LLSGSLEGGYHIVIWDGVVWPFNLTCQAVTDTAIVTTCCGCDDRGPYSDDSDDQAYLARLYKVCPQIAVAEALVEEVAAVLREREVDQLDRWLRGAEASGMKEVQALARTIWLDRAAVEAAVRVDWSNGPVEGHVNKLKLLKRLAYGRSAFDLLRRRAVHAA